MGTPMWKAGRAELSPEMGTHIARNIFARVYVKQGYFPRAYILSTEKCGHEELYNRLGLREASGLNGWQLLDERSLRELAITTPCYYRTLPWGHAGRRELAGIIRRLKAMEPLSEKPQRRWRRSFNSGRLRDTSFNVLGFVVDVLAEGDWTDIFFGN